MSIVGALLVVLGAAVPMPDGHTVTWPEFSAPQECNPVYAEALARAKRSLAHGEYRAAADAFQAALATPCHEIPNYQLYGPLAEALCRAGQASSGNELLPDYECMLAVDVGERRCYASASEPSAPPVRASGLTDRCFNVMCGEMLIPYYEEPTAVLRARVSQLRAAMKQLALVCGANK